MNTLNRKGSLVSSRLLASVGGMATLSASLSMGLLTESASADLGPGSPVYVLCAWDNAPGSDNFVIDLWQGYAFAGYTVPLYSYFASGYDMNVGIGASSRPGFQYEAVLDFNPAVIAPVTYPGYAPFDLMYVYLGIKGNLNPGGPVTNFEVKNFNGDVLGGGVSANGAGIALYVPIAQIIGANGTGGGDDILIIQWNQGSAPAPGALALLGLSGLVGSRRRRS